MNYLANHQIIEFNDCEEEQIKDAQFMRHIFWKAAQMGNATIVNNCFHEFNPQGITGVLVIEESHLSVHTWPEHKYVAVDIFSCGNKINHKKITEFLKEKFKCNNVSSISINRGEFKKENI